MFFVLSKLLAYFIQPFNIVMLLVAASFFIKKAVWKKRMRIASLVIFIFFSNGVIFDQFLRSWEKPAILISELDNDYDLFVLRICSFFF